MTPLSESPPFELLTEVRREYERLLELEPDVPGEDPGFLNEVQLFLRQASDFGRILFPIEERRVIQTYVTYWTTYLYRAGIDPAASTLERFDHEATLKRLGKRTPYVGLSSFGEGDAPFFFGRSKVIEALVARLAASRMALVIGASGSGKSSLVRAGLIPALKKGAIDGSEGWFYPEPVIPGNSSLAALAAAVNQEASQMEANPAGLSAGLSKLSDGRPVLLVIDQFEEVFIEPSDNAQVRISANATQAAFVKALHHLLLESTHYLVLTMRRDSESYLKKFEEFAKAAEKVEVRVSAPAESELRDMIQGPAATLGVEFEKGAVDDLIERFLGKPGNLPLLEFALSRLWVNRTGNAITRQDIDQLGDPSAALAKAAQRHHKGENAEGQDLMRRLVIQLVQPGLGENIYRRRVARRVLHKDLGRPSQVDFLITQLANEGLLRVTPGLTEADDQIEVTHETIFENSSLLKGWVSQDRQLRSDRVLFEETVLQWDKNPAPSLLLPESRLQEVKKFERLSEAERRFITANERVLTRGKRRLGIAFFIPLLGILLSVLALFDYRFSLGKARINLSDAISNLKISNDTAEDQRTRLRETAIKLIDTQTKLTEAEKRKNALEVELGRTQERLRELKKLETDAVERVKGETARASQASLRAKAASTRATQQAKTAKEQTDKAKGAKKELLLLQKDLKETEGRLRAAKKNLVEFQNRAIASGPNTPVSAIPVGGVYTLKLWTAGATLRVRFLDGDEGRRQRVITYAREWTRYANLNLQLVEKGDAEIRISFAKPGSWSYLGTDALTINAQEPTVNFGFLLPETGEDVFRQTVLHEFGHVLGLVHENQNPQAQIPWDRPVVYSAVAGAPYHWSRSEADRNILGTFSLITPDYRPFDQDSIMLYPFPKEWFTNRTAIGGATVLSKSDQELARRLYPGRGG